jgi:hypothetical protein
MTTTTHRGSIHIDAPVEKVFDHVKDPHNVYHAFPQEMTISDEHMTRDLGAGSTYKVHGHLLFLPVSGTATRTEYVPNERIVDHSSAGPDYTFSVAPDDAGTTLTFLYEYSSTVPFLDKIGDKLEWKGDRDIDTWLRNLKKGIEA